MDQTLTKEELGLILSYLLVYQDLLEKEVVVNTYQTYGMRLDYLSSHAAYEKALGKLMTKLTPLGTIEKLRKIRELCEAIETDVVQNFNL